MIRLLMVIAFLAFTREAEAQNCKKGIPCGNSCISATKVCRIGTTPPAAPRQSESPDPLPARGLLSSAAAPEGGAWVASVDGTVYYSAGCATARKLSEDERVYFTTEIDARIQGYKRSKARNC